MPRETQLGPSCQSCAAPLMRADDFGREVSGVLRTDYCIHCYDRGALIQPDITFDQMVEKVAAMMAKKRNMTDEVARAQTKSMLRPETLARKEDRAYGQLSLVRRRDVGQEETLDGAGKVDKDAY